MISSATEMMFGYGHSSAGVDSFGTHSWLAFVHTRSYSPHHDYMNGMFDHPVMCNIYMVL